MLQQQLPQPHEIESFGLLSDQLRLFDDWCWLFVKENIKKVNYLNMLNV